MVIEEDKVIELEDNSRHLLIKKVRAKGIPYLICLRLTNGLLFEVFRFGDDQVSLETDPAVVSEVLDAYVSSDAYAKDMENIEAEVSKIVGGSVDEGDEE